MKVLLIIHSKRDGPGSLAEFLDKASVEPIYCRLYEGDKLPAPDVIDTVVTLGGHMNVKDTDKYPFLKDELLFLNCAIELGKPVLGICLGAQLLAKACGAQVYKAPVPEIGWFDIDLNECGRNSQIFSGLPDTFTALQWHRYTFDVPNGGELLATSKDCPNQAFIYKNALGLQFHIEIDYETLSAWIKATSEDENFLDIYSEMEEKIEKIALTIYSNFLRFAALAR